MISIARTYVPPAQYSNSMVIYTNLDHYYWYQYSGPLHIWPIFFVAVMCGLIDLLNPHISKCLKLLLCSRNQYFCKWAQLYRSQSTLKSDYKLVLLFLAFSGMEQSGRVARLVQLFENPANIQGKYFLCLTTIDSNEKAKAVEYSKFQIAKCLWFVHWY